eukprot:Cvel_28183.t1-p1 / transcript=Cvel_28183.t1 / gene=Cvel_28183 / organism=Chromera_velia_CCMP2878 / gene_product=hypothetical protein / transcript_product=hypothetical protein / location=Cvel_scaffold3643:103-11441(-) / protein_length=411 / sequence_SO=supercontig / SO=protein_coding / is_pseudo=false
MSSGLHLVSSGITAEGTAEAVFERVILEYGMPQSSPLRNSESPGTSTSLHALRLSETPKPTNPALLNDGRTVKPDLSKKKDPEPMLLELPMATRKVLANPDVSEKMKEHIVAEEEKKQRLKEKMEKKRKSPVWQPKGYFKRYQRRKYLIDQLQKRRAEKEKAMRIPKLVPAKKRLPISMYQVGDRVRGRVLRVRNFGVWIDFGCTQNGLLHLRDMDDGWTKSPMQKMQPGDEVEAVIKYLDPQEGVVGLTRRAWEVPVTREKLEQNRERERKSEGEPQAENAGTRETSASEEEDLKEFERQRLMKRQKQSLRYTMANADERIAVGSFQLNQKVAGYVRRVTDLGAYVDIGANVDAFFHIMDIEDPYKDRGGKDHKKSLDFFQPGQRLDPLYVKNVDAFTNRIQVSPWTYRV